MDYRFIEMGEVTVQGNGTPVHDDDVAARLRDDQCHLARKSVDRSQRQDQ